MHLLCKSALALMALTVFGLSTSVAHGSTVITGSYDNNKADGYIADGPGAFVVGPDTGGAPSAEFDNDAVGLAASGSASVTISGGQFDSNSFAGIDADDASIIITAGTFSGNQDFAIYSADSGAVSVYGGILSSSNAEDFGAGGTGGLDIYGSFAGLTPGETDTFNTGSDGVSGTFIGTLEDNTVAQTYSYFNSGRITLHDVSVAPEPSSSATIGLIAIGLGALLLRARRRRAE